VAKHNIFNKFASRRAQTSGQPTSIARLLKYIQQHALHSISSSPLW